MSERVIFARVARDDEYQLRAEFLAASQQEANAYRGHMDFRPDPTSSELVCIAGGAGDTTFGLLSMYEVGSRGWFIDLLYVRPEARGVGIGSAMMNVALEILRGKDAVRINAATLPGDRSTKNLFERHGLVAQMITVSKTLQ